MNILLFILAVIAAIVAVVLIAALFVDKQYSIKREIIINRPLGEVFDFVRHLTNQEKFNKWVMTDPNMKKELRGTDGTVGFVYAWNGNKAAGEGELEITGLREGERVDTEVRFVRPFKSIARTPIVTEPVTQDQTRVIWGMEGENKYPLNLMTAMLAGVLGKDLEVSLQSLKRVLESAK